VIILFVIIEFLCGSLMFSYWLGRAVKIDLRLVGDGNPGAFNLWHATGYKLGLLGIASDFLKGYMPLVILVHWNFVSGMALVPVAIAPVLGHAFSPFVDMRGGKAITVSFGVWSAISGFEISLVYAIILAILLIIVKLTNWNRPIGTDTDGFMVVAGMITLSIYIFLRAYPVQWLMLSILNSLVLLFTNRIKLYRFFKQIIVKEQN